MEVRLFSSRDRRFRDLAHRSITLDEPLDAAATEIIGRIREGGTGALLQCVRETETKAVSMETLRVAETEIAAARDSVSEQFLTSLSLARVNIRRFHEYQRRRGYISDDTGGVRISRQVRSLRRVGICCGGSSIALLLHAIPAQVAGVGEIAVAAAPRADGSIDPKILATAKSLGLEEVHRMSGAAAVAAMTFGVGPVAKVDKIVGPGGPLAAAAKRRVAGLVGVDGDPGLGELVVVADESANAKFIAGDILAQAEHGGDCGLLVVLTTDRMLAEAVRIEIDRHAELLPNAELVRHNIARFGAVYYFPGIQSALDAANALAPARLTLMTRDNESCLSEIETAGAVFMGPWSVEAAADYFSGINAFLPVAGRARFSSGLGVDDFVREMSVVEYGPDRLLMTGRHVETLVEADALPAHVEAIRERLELLRLTVD